MDKPALIDDRVDSHYGCDVHRRCAQSLLWFLVLLQAIALCQCRMQQIGGVPQQASPIKSNAVFAGGSAGADDDTIASGKACPSHIRAGGIVEHEDRALDADLIAIAINQLDLHAEATRFATSVREISVVGQPTPSRNLPLLI